MICGTYSVLNKTRKVQLSSETEIAGSVFKRIRGLIGRRSQEFAPGSGLLIRPSNGIHTFGMKFPIDAVYLDSKEQILKIYHKLPPYRLAAMVLKARSVLELPAGTLACTHTEVGDFLEFQKVENGTKSAPAQSKRE